MKQKRLSLLTAFVLACIISNAQWLLTGNAGTNPTTNFIGTRDARTLNIRTNNITRMIVRSDGGVSITDPGSSTNNSHPLLLYMEKYSQGGALQIGMMSPTNGSAGIWAVTRGPGYASAGIGSLAGSVGVYGSNSYGVGVQGESYNTWGIVARSTNYYGLVAIGNNYAAYFVGNVFTSGNYYAASDQKLKKDIEEIPGAMNLINQLQPKKYNYKSEGNYAMMKLPKGTQYGLIAQDVEKILPDLVNDTKYDAPIERDDDGRSAAAQFRKQATVEYKALNYTGLIPIIIKGMQEQEQKLSKQQETLNEQKQKIEELEELVNQLIRLSPLTTSGNAASNNKKHSNTGSLEQNAPNPFNQSTVIRYMLPVNAQNAFIHITDMNGKMIRSFPVSNANGQLIIKSGQFQSGTYQYSLVINGRITDTKKMMLLK